MPQGLPVAQRRMSVEPMVPPLTRNGYTRTARAEADIRAAWDSGGRELVAAASILEGEAGHLCAEALVFLIRREISSGDRRTAEALFSELVSRAQRALRTMIRGFDDDARQDMQAEVLGDMTRLILADDDRGDFLQSRFWLYLRRRASTARMAWLRSKPAVVDEPLEERAASRGGEIAAGGLSPEERALVLDALGRLPPELRELVVLRHYEEWRIGDEDRREARGSDGRPGAGEPTLAERYGITPRGVRKRLSRAEALLTMDQREDG